MAVLLVGSVLVVPDPSGAGEPGSDVEPIVYANSTGTAAGGPGTVAVIGDSLTRQMSTELPSAFGDDWFVHVDGRDSALFRDQQSVAAAIAATAPEAVAINLGTNDTGCVMATLYDPSHCAHVPFTDADAIADQLAMVSLFSPETCIVGVSVYFGEVTDSRWYELVQDGVVDGVVEWEPIVSAHPEYRSDDFGHLTEPAIPVAAATIADGVERVCRPDAAPPPSAYEVDVGGDGFEAVYGDGRCADLTGHCTLRGALLEAMAPGGPGEIEISVPSVTLSLPNLLPEQSGRTGDLDLVGPFIIEGHGLSVRAEPGLDGVMEVVAGSVEVRDVAFVDTTTTATPVVSVGSGSTLRLTDVEMRGNETGRHPIVHGEGTLIVEDSLIVDNRGAKFAALLLAGGGEVRDTVFEANTAVLGGGLVAMGLDPVTVDRVAFERNVATLGGGALVLGPHELHEVTFDANVADRGGGLIAAGTTTLERLAFTDNAAREGGGLVGLGVVVSDSTFVGNQGQAGAGAVLSDAHLQDSRLERNHATQWGGGLLTQESVTVAATVFTENSAELAGAGVAVVGAGTVSIEHSELSANAAEWGGGLLVIEGSVAIGRSTLSGNQAGASGGAIANLGAVELSEVTVTDNTSVAVGGILTFGPGEVPDVPAGGMTAIGGSVIGDQRAGVDCGGIGRVVSNGGSVATSTGCVSGPDDLVTSSGLGLEPLAENGGPTRTHLPTLLGPVVDAGPATCGPSDQRGAPRPVDRCDAGAVEVQSAD